MPQPIPAMRPNNEAVCERHRSNDRDDSRGRHLQTLVLKRAHQDAVADFAKPLDVDQGRRPLTLRGQGAPLWLQGQAEALVLVGGRSEAVEAEDDA
ncbi:Uu.00g037650.m01.CDS01 [Anthostomella pinea]|uniref:Uu.00g037650.m01.CDS01 n=1 Tax=Anthostomella pinea TaxID=933095 RepID=A0AAI8YDP0_9PEZI|nr:Uu.00g037650.m01.CDS01 [Anthostomella pinea]